MDILIATAIGVILFVGTIKLIEAGFRRLFSKSPGPKRERSNTGQSRKKDTLWLRERWKLAKEYQSKGDYQIFGEWYFEGVTEAQLARLASDGQKKTDRKISRGEASDLIGLDCDPGEGELQVLKFFKVDASGMSQTRARHEIAVLWSTPQNQGAWLNRPPDLMTREEAKFYGVKLPKGVTLENATKLISDYLDTLDEDEASTLEDEWAAYDDIIEQLTDRDSLECYEIRKPNKTLIKKVIKEHLDSGKSYLEINSDFMEELVERLIELDPKLPKDYF